MPNGGSDNCLTCWYNSTHEGKVGYFRRWPWQKTRCLIRNLAIESDAYTYCANHPYHSAQKIGLPIGAVYRLNDDTVTRRVLVESPDTEAIRLMLLRLLDQMPERPPQEYPTWPKRDEEVIMQLQRFHEQRAIPGLKRVCRFDPLATSPGDTRSITWTRVGTIARALEALGCIAGDEALPELARGLEAGLGSMCASDRDDCDVPMAMIRAFSLRGLEHCSVSSSRALVLRALDDPDSRVSTLAREILEKDAAPGA